MVLLSKNDTKSEINLINIEKIFYSHLLFLHIIYILRDASNLLLILF
jgi:hypothetical protein